MARTPKRYSAGSIMLQVVPTLRGIEQTIDEGAKKIKDGNVKAAKEAAEASAKERARVEDKELRDAQRRMEKATAERVKLEKKIADERTAAAKKSAANVAKLEEDAFDAEMGRIEQAAKARQKAIEDEAAARKKAEEAAAKAEADRQRDFAKDWDRRRKIAMDLGKEDAARTAAARKAEEDAAKADRDRILQNWNLRLKTINDEWDAKQKAHDAEMAALEKESAARQAAIEKEQKAKDRAREKEARFERAFRHGQDLAGLAGERSVRDLDPRGHRKLARDIQRVLTEQTFDIEVKPDGDMFEREMAELITRMKALREMRVGIDIDASDFNREYMQTQARIANLERQKVNIEIKGQAGDLIASSAAAAASLKAVELQAYQTNRATRDTDRSVGSAANSFRAMNGVLLAAVAIGPVLIPILASIGGLLVGIAAGAVGVGLAVGTMVLGLMGIGTAIEAMSKADKEARQRAAQQSGVFGGGPRTVRQPRTTRYADMRAELSRRNALRNARERLDEARADAPTAINDAIRRQESAERALIDTQERARRTQQDLNDARREAARDLEDLAFRIRGANLDEQEAVYQMQAAGIRYNAVLEDDQATAREKDQARIDYEQAKLRNEEMIVQNRRLREEAEKANAAGVEGSDKVVAAKEAVAQAEQDTIDATQAVRDAEADTARVRVEQAERIAEAERALTDLIEDQRLARLAGIEADQQAAAAAAAAAAGTEAFNTQAFELQEAMNDLSPAGQRFATWLYGLKPFLDEMKFTVQETFLPGLQTALALIVDQYGPGFLEFLGEMGTALGDGAIEIAEWLTGPEMAGFFATMAEYGPTWFGQFLDIAMGFSEGAFLIFEQLAPFATILGEAVVGLAEAFAQWAASEEGQAAIAAFVGYLLEAGPEVWQLFASAMGAIVNLMIALAPYGGTLVDLFTAIFDWIAGMDPEDLAMIASTIMAIVVAFQVFAVVSALILTVTVAIAAGFSSVALIVAAVVAVLVGLTIWIVANWPKIKAWFIQLYEDYIKPVIDKIAQAWNWLYDNVLYPIWEGIKLGLDALGAALTILYNLWVIGIDLLGDLWNWLYDNYIGPVVEEVRGALERVGEWIETHLVPIWERALGTLGAIWNTLAESAKKPIRFVIETLINKGIIDGFNKFAENFPGTVPVKHLTVPSWLQPAEYATGTSNVVLPGYTPGRDVHRFVSPTGGVIDLSGGEGILRPEAVRALGPEWIDRINAAARQRGSVGVLRHLGAYADGGVLGAIGNAVGGAAGALSSVVGTVMEFVKDPKKALEEAVRALLGNWETDNSFGSLLLSVPRAIIKAASDYVRSIFTPDVIEKSALIPAGGSGGTSGTGFNLKGWANPTFGPITSRWGPRSMFGNSFHAGTDIAGGGPVYAAAAGKVLHAGLVNPFVAPGRSGSVVQILHGDGTVTWYGHMLPKNMTVKKGDVVGSGDRIGLQGALGRVTGVHLHYETHRGQDKGNGLDPQPFMRQRGVELGKGLLNVAGGSGGKPALMYDNGGYLQPGYTTVLNATGKPEPVLTDEQWRAIREARSTDGGRGIFDGAILQGYDPEELYAVWEERRRRESVLNGSDDLAVMIP